MPGLQYSAQPCANFAQVAAHKYDLPLALCIFPLVPAQISGDFAELFESGFEVFDDFLSKNVEVQEDCRILRGFRLSARRPASRLNRSFIYSSRTLSLFLKLTLGRQIPLLFLSHSDSEHILHLFRPVIPL